MSDSEIHNKSDKSTKENENSFKETIKVRREVTPSKTITRFKKKAKKQCKKMKLDYSEYYQEMKQREQKRASSRRSGSKKNLAGYSNHLNIRLRFPADAQQEYSQGFARSPSRPKDPNGHRKIQFQGFIKKQPRSRQKSKAYLSQSGRKYRSVHQNSSKKRKRPKNQSLLRQSNQSYKRLHQKNKRSLEQNSHKSLMK